MNGEGPSTPRPPPTLVSTSTSTMLQGKVSKTEVVGEICKECQKGPICDVSLVTLKETELKLDVHAHGRLRASALSTDVKNALGKGTTGLLDVFDAVLEVVADPIDAPPKAEEKGDEWKKGQAVVSFWSEYVMTCVKVHPWVSVARRDTSAAVGELPEPKHALSLPTARFPAKGVLSGASTFGQVLKALLSSNPAEYAFTASSCGWRGPANPAAATPSPVPNGELKALLRVFRDEEWALEFGGTLFVWKQTRSSTIVEGDFGVNEDVTGKDLFSGSISSSTKSEDYTGGLKRDAATTKGEEVRDYKRSTEGLTRTREVSEGYQRGSDYQQRSKTRRWRRSRDGRDDKVVKEASDTSKLRLRGVPRDIELKLLRNGEELAETFELYRKIKKVLAAIKQANSVAQNIQAVLSKIRATFSIGWTLDVDFKVFSGWIHIGWGASPATPNSSGRFVGVGSFVEVDLALVAFKVKLDLGFGLEVSAVFASAKARISLAIDLEFRLDGSVRYYLPRYCLSESNALTRQPLSEKEAEEKRKLESSATATITVKGEVAADWTFGSARAEAVGEGRFVAKVEFSIKPGPAVSAKLSSYFDGLKCWASVQGPDNVAEVWPKDGPYVLIKGNKDAPYEQELFG